MTDRQAMRAALRLAGRGFTRPNPMVGALVVAAGGEVIGRGFHPRAGEPHAEVFALRQAGERARGATLFVTLEPCSHVGRTPPCADAVVAAGIARVVAAMEDPNPLVAGRGLARLHDAGIAVEVGLLAEEARRLNAPFVKWHATGLPHVRLKTAMTLDGKIAARTGDARWVTGPAARRFVHGLRARADAVVTGIGTVLADDPLLTARLTPPSPLQPARVVVDSRLRTPPDARLLSSPGGPVIVACVEGSERPLPGAEVLPLPPDPAGRVDLRALVAGLGRRGMQGVLLEAGGELAAAAIAAGVVDTALAFVAPKIVGGRDAPTPVGGEGAARMADALELIDVRWRRYGRDLAIEGELAGTGGGAGRVQ